MEVFKIKKNEIIINQTLLSDIEKMKRVNFAFLSQNFKKKVIIDIWNQIKKLDFIKDKKLKKIIRTYILNLHEHDYKYLTIINYINCVTNSFHSERCKNITLEKAQNWLITQVFDYMIRIIKFDGGQIDLLNMVV